MQLVINTFGASIKKYGKMFRIQCSGQHLDVAASKISSIIITTGTHLSSDTFYLAYQHNIDIIFFDKYGKPYGRFWLPCMGSTARIRREQLVSAETDTGLDVVRNWTQTKLQNQCDFLQDLKKKRPKRIQDFEKALAGIQTQLAKLEHLNGTIEERRHTILGTEGTAARIYWSLIGSLPPKSFQFEKRSKHPAKDPFNAMLNYAYGVLYSEVERACLIAALDPFVGLLHTDNYNKHSLVYDLIEPFRIWADRTVTKLFTGRRCKDDMFTATATGITLEKKAKELLLGQFENYLETPVRYRIKSSKSGKTRQIKRRACIQAEAHTLANRLLNKEAELPEVMETSAVFAEEASTDEGVS